MRKITEVNWETNEELPNLENYKGDSSVSSDSHSVSFMYNGFRVDALVHYKIYLETETVAGASDHYGNYETWTEVNANDFDLKLIKMYYNEGEDFYVPTKEYFNINNQLLTELQTQF